ncbi:MAG: right-handed parallel beta-helix repeat-containing protein [Chloroflexi bacterium]|nr:right-handed parallel beta-helix repeat-containing protein [Chloroflexota bacterium]
MKRICCAGALLIALLLPACAAEEQTDAPENSAPLAATVQLVATPTLDATATITPTFTKTATPTITPTFTKTPTPTTTPTPLPVINLSACAPIWQPGYYKIIADIKTPQFDCFQVQGHNIVIDCDNHLITGNNFQGYAFFVLKFRRPLIEETPTNVEIKNCRVTKHRTGIFVGGANNLYLHHNDLSGNYDDVNQDRFGIFLGQAEGGGIRLDTVRGGRVEFNTTNREAVGIDARDSDNIAIRNNTASFNSAWGINLINTSNSEIANNTTENNIRYCAWGTGVVARGCDAGGIILQDGSSNNVVKENNVTGENGNGIFIKAHASRCGNNNVIQKNKIIDAVYNAIEFSFCKDNQVLENELSGSFDAVWFGFSTNTIVRGNTIRNMRNHGINSINSRGSVIENNKIANAGEGIYFSYLQWDPKAFFFLPPSPDQYAQRDNTISNNTLADNAVAAIRVSDYLNSRVFDNVFANNAKNIWVEGKTDGSMIVEGNGH